MSFFVFSNLKFEPNKSIDIRPGDTGLKKCSSHADRAKSLTSGSTCKATRTQIVDPPFYPPDTTGY